jgi:glutamate decarboxylase
MIESHLECELVTSPTLSLLTHRLNPQHVQKRMKMQPKMVDALNIQLDDLTVTVQKQQTEAGKSFVSRTRSATEKYPEQPITVFRVVLANPLTSETDLQNLLNAQISIANNTDIWKA